MMQIPPNDERLALPFREFHRGMALATVLQGVAETGSRPSVFLAMDDPNGWLKLWELADAIDTDSADDADWYVADGPATDNLPGIIKSGRTGVILRNTSDGSGPGMAREMLKHLTGDFGGGKGPLDPPSAGRFWKTARKLAKKSSMTCVDVGCVPAREWILATLLERGMDHEGRSQIRRFANGTFGTCPGNDPCIDTVSVMTGNEKLARGLVERFNRPPPSNGAGSDAAAMNSLSILDAWAPFLLESSLGSRAERALRHCGELDEKISSQSARAHELNLQVASLSEELERKRADLERVIARLEQLESDSEKLENLRKRWLFRSYMLLRGKKIGKTPPRESP